MEPVTPSRRATFDLPKPETGLAEWTSKIKALQRQVDADEEAEQKRLEEEIVAARRARLRRSRGYGGDSIDLSTSPSTVATPLSKLDKLPSSDALKSSLETYSDQDTDLRKVVGAPPPTNVDTSSITQGVLPRPSQFPVAQTLPSQRPDPVSLASFMGGRATGPRLNRHAPQQDAHDPTQFEQRSNIGPHPIFGKGGVAMPGMVTKTGGTVRDAVKASEAVERYQPRLAKRASNPSLVKSVEEIPAPRSVSPQKTGSRDRTISTPPVARKYPKQTEPRLVSPQKTSLRERTLSTPGPTPAALKSIDNFTSRSSVARQTPESPVVGIRPKTPTRDSILPTPSRAPISFSSSSEKSVTPRYGTPIVNSPAKPSISIPSLARPILPEPRPRSQSPVTIVNPSPAFQKQSPQKDPTPSISRLQGRGFVQSMVRASAQFETPPTSSPPTTSRPGSGRKSTVLNRWQPTATPPSPTPISLPRQVSPVRKGFSELSTRSELPSNKPPPPVSATPPPAPAKILKQKTSHPLLHPDPLAPQEPLSPRRAKVAETMLPPDGSPGFGSATTMVVYKLKTPEKSSPPEEPVPSSSVDELGVRRDSNVKGKVRFAGPSELPNTEGKPLNHPTKDRARKPKKNRDASGGAQSKTTSISEPAQRTGFLLPRSPQLSHQSSPSAVSEPALFSPPSPSPSPFNTPRVSNHATEKDLTSRVSIAAQKWGQNRLIGVKSVSLSPAQGHAQTYQSEVGSKIGSNLIRRALPGMTPGGDDVRPSQVVTKSKSPSPESTLQVLDDPALMTSSQDVSPSSTSKYEKSPDSTGGPLKSSSPVKGDRQPPRSPSSPKHTRIPSTGNRARVMDVAQALSEYNTLNGENAKVSDVVLPPAPEPTPEPVFAPRSIVPPPPERRRSSYERFSIVSVMPPLKEEATPGGTPVGTLTRTAGTLLQSTLNKREFGAVDEHLQGTKGTKQEQKLVHFDIDDVPLPFVDISSLLHSHKTIYLVSPDIQTISVDVFSINGTSSTTVTRDADIFYDTEILVVVHRHKSKASGLVSTQLWVWYGMKSTAGEKERHKLQELAKRYNTPPTTVHQNSEPPQLVQLLGGQVVIRQGSRSHWSTENTAMYSVRKFGGVIYIDEHDLSITNLCSAFSYCITILDTIYVWHGCGSTDAERHAAARYASRIGKEQSPVIQLLEGENDSDELFWMALGDDEFAKADYWRWRRNSPQNDPRIWRVDAKTNPSVIAITSLREGNTESKSVYIVDCVWEHFVLVGHEARGDRINIRLALDVARRLAENSASSRPFTPTVHVLVLPSRLPMDLRLNLRELDDAKLNNDGIPDHMNLLSSSQAGNHLQQRSWEREVLQDQTMLPLGVSAAAVQ